MTTIEHYLPLCEVCEHRDDVIRIVQGHSFTCSMIKGSCPGFERRTVKE